MQNNQKNTIIDVIPLTRLPLSRQQSFSYLNNEKIPFGSLVSIPLFRRNVNGIVIGNRDDFFRFGNIKLRKINKILDENFLTEKQLEIAKFVSDYYLCPLGIVLKFFVVKKTKARNVKPATHNTKLEKINLSKEQKEIVKKLLSKKVTGCELQVTGALFISGGEKIEIYLELISRTMKNNQQTLLLVGEIPLVWQVFDIIKEYFDENKIALFHSKLTNGELYKNYQRIRSGEAKIIIGTRQAVFAPFDNLGMIIVDEEQDISYKQWDMNPRYNARNVAEKLAELFEAKIVLSSPAPSLEAYYKIQNSKLIQNSKFKIQNSVDIVDLRKEGWDRNGKRKKNVLISKKLESEISFALKYDKQIFLLSGRRGMNNFSVCRKCKEVLKCPRCERALIYDKEGIYRCLHCPHKTDIFPKCQNCGSTEFQNLGIGNQGVEREINKIFPGTKIKLIDFESLKNKKDQRELFKEINNKKFDIIIGTQTILKSWSLPHLGLIGIISADELFGFSDFNSDERAFQSLQSALSKNAKMIIQTYNTENPIIKTIGNPDFEKFYQEEMEKRKALKYPPFYRIIKLILRTQFKEKMEKGTNFIFGRIKILSQKYPEISVFEPFDPKLSKVRDKFRRQIVVKISGNKIPEELEKTLKSLESDWIIDVDPINLV